MLFQRRINLFFIPLFVFATACKTRALYYAQAASFANMKVKHQDATKVDTALMAMLQPYQDSLSKTMNEVIGYNAAELEKGEPDGLLGLFMTDAMLQMAEQQLAIKIDFATTNSGGIRINSLPKGDITVGKIFELMPFDNELVVQKIKGTVVRDFVTYVISRGGWPFRGLQVWTNKDKQVSKVLIQGQPIDPEREYAVALSDYLANGGDNCDFLKKIVQQKTGLTIRDAIIKYVRYWSQKGQSLQVDRKPGIIVE
jgi:2',3'-cyclic-nucleotide 2'-phosphodiesterase (5'-nucleotidase family)